jgi:hypothetical protein
MWNVLQSGILMGLAKIKWLGVALVLSLAAASQCAAQGFGISGTVRDPSRKPLANVAVELATRSQGRRITGTDEKGGYVFGGLTPGEYQVSFELAGYVTLVRTVSVKFDKDPKDDDKDLKETDKPGDATLVPNKSRSKK